MFWVGILISMLIVVGASVFVGKFLSRPRSQPMSRKQQMTAVKASGALKHQKSGRGH